MLIDDDGLYHANKNYIFSEFIEINLWILNNIYSEDKDKIFIEALIDAHCEYRNYSESDAMIFQIEIWKKFKYYNGLWDKNQGSKQYKLASIFLENIFHKPVDNQSLCSDILLYIFTRIKYHYTFKKELYLKNSEYIG